MSKAQEEITDILGVGPGGRSTTGWRVYGAAFLILIIAGAIAVVVNRQANAPLLTTAEVRTRTIIARVSAVGSIEPTNLVEVSSELSGTLATVEADYNDVVDVGQVLATLDTAKLNAQLEVQKASLDSAIAQVAIAQASLEETKEKYESGVALDRRGVNSRHSLITQKAAYQRAKAELQSARANQSLAQANLDLQQTDLEKARIVSPIKGVVLDRLADAGQIVASSLSTPLLFTIAEDLTKMELQVDVDEADIGRIRVGDPAVFTVEAYDAQKFPATISEIRYAPKEVSGVVTYKAILTVDNSDLLLRPGMTATADITVDQVDDVLAVPNAALRYLPPVEESEGSGGFFGSISIQNNRQKAGNSKTVWVERDGTPQEIDVETGLSDGRFTQILSGALSLGDSVIVGRTTPQ